jgi:cytochrome c2
MFQMNRKRIMVAMGLLFGILFLTLPTTFAGGWAAVTLDSLPVAPQAGEKLQLGFMVRQHGITPVNSAWGSSVQPYLAAANRDTGESIQVQARQEGPAGHFVVEVTFPSPGTWSWHIAPEPFPSIPSEFEPLTVLPAPSVPAEAAAPVRSGSPASAWWPVIAGLLLIGGLGLMTRRGIITGRLGIAAGVASLLLLALIAFTWLPGFSRVTISAAANTEISATNPPADAAYGRALFVAKGCPACHIHAQISNSIPGPLLGPVLTNYQPDPDFLRPWLRNPQKVRPTTQMPDLDLDEPEIESLIAFLEANTAK